MIVLGVTLLVIGAILRVVGALDHTVGGREHYWHQPTSARGTPQSGRSHPSLRAVRAPAEHKGVHQHG